MKELYIKNMVCDRCIMVVKDVFAKLGLHPEYVKLGMVRLEEDNLDDRQLSTLKSVLNDLGFELLDDNRTRLVDTIKQVIINKIHHSDTLEEKVNWSKLISDQVFHEYNYLSTLFSSVEETTIEQYIIRQKIEKVKELLSYNEFNLGEISGKLGYSSIAHLSAQFKKITGQTPSQFKQTKDSDKNRKPIDSV